MYAVVQLVKSGGQLVLKVGESLVDYNPSFKLYLSTKLHNPRFSPETYAKVNVLNFMATSEGLVEQMLVIVVSSEAPDMEVQSEQLRREIADYGRLVADMEDRVLELLSGDVSEKLLDDEVVITTLSVRLLGCCKHKWCFFAIIELDGACCRVWLLSPSKAFVVYVYPCARVGEGRCLIFFVIFWLTVFDVSPP